MKYTIDFEITPDLKEKYGDNLKEQAYANFCVSFVNQIKEKLNFSDEKLKAKKQVKKEINDNGLVKVELVSKDVEVYRFTMDFPVLRKKIKNVNDIKKKPLPKYKKGSEEK